MPVTETQIDDTSNGTLTEAIARIQDAITHYNDGLITGWESLLQMQNALNWVDATKLKAQHDEAFEDEQGCIVEPVITTAPA